jgi:hypothetical protein
MIDVEVMRLRRLRNAALRARAMAAVLDSHPAQRSSLFARSGQSCWQIARAISGRLRAHPYLSFRRGPSAARAVYDHVSALVMGGIARYRGRSLEFYGGELRRVARELDDARALTWSPDLSDDLGRSQARLRRLIRELEAAVPAEAGAGVDGTARLESRAQAVPASGAAVDDHWPYLNI